MFAALLARTTSCRSHHLPRPTRDAFCVQCSRRKRTRIHHPWCASRIYDCEENTHGDSRTFFLHALVLRIPDLAPLASLFVFYHHLDDPPSLSYTKRVRTTTCPVTNSPHPHPSLRLARSRRHRSPGAPSAAASLRTYSSWLRRLFRVSSRRARSSSRYRRPR